MTEITASTPLLRGTDEELREILDRDGIYACTRVWAAWSFGTMTEDDFLPAAESVAVDWLAEWRDAAVRAELERIMALLSSPDASARVAATISRMYDSTDPGEHGTARAVMQVIGGLL